MGTSPEKRKNVLESIENNAQAISHFSSEDTYSEGVTESKKFLNYIDEQSLKKGHSVVLIKLKREDLNNANTNATELVKAAFTLIHEMEFHGLDYKDKKDDKPAEDEHIENYKDPKFYKINSGEYSPTYENIKLKSRAGEIKKIIEETLKKMQEQKKAENAPQKPVEKPKKVKGA